MQRFVGSVLILSATTWSGILYGREQQMYLDNMLYLRHIIQMIKSELAYTNLPLSDIFRRIAVRVRQPFRKWLYSLERQIEKRDEKDFCIIWETELDRCLSQLSLKKQHKTELRELGDYIGKMDRISEEKNLEMYLDNLELEIKKMRNEISNKKRLGKCIGVMSGLFLVILLI